MALINIGDPSTLTTEEIQEHNRQIWVNNPDMDWGTKKYLLEQNNKLFRRKQLLKRKARNDAEKGTHYITPIKSEPISPVHIKSEPISPVRIKSEPISPVHIKEPKKLCLTLEERIFKRKEYMKMYRRRKRLEAKAKKGVQMICID